MNKQDLNQAEIRWTDNDVPHIKAGNYEALGFGYGCVHARDRLLELAGQAIALRGERSKYYGADGFSTVGFLKTTNLNSDLIFRMRLPDAWVEQALAKLSHKIRDYICGYVNGLNHYVNHMPDDARRRLSPDEHLVTFEPADVVRSAMRFGIMKELVEIGPYIVSSSRAWQENPPDAADSENSPHARAVETEGGFGSNAWAFGGDVVEGEGAILLGNPHSAWKRTPHQQRIYMHQYHLTIPGELDVAGTSFLGFPLPMTGYNADVSWSILDAATVTPYVLQKMVVAESDGQLTYLMDGETKPLSVRSVTIDVLENDGQVKPRTYEFIESELGILYQLPERPGKPKGWYAITNPGENNACGLDQFLEAAKAGSAREFVAAIENNRGILCQLVVADRHGEVGYVVAGNVPPLSDEAMAQCHIGDETAAFHVLDGTRSDCALRDADNRPLQAPASFYPNVITRGVIQNTNNSYKFTEYGKIQPDYPSVFGQHKDDHQIGKHIAAGLRYDPRLMMSVRRIKELLAKGPVTPESALRIIFDNRNYAAETFLDDILTLSELAGSEAARKGFAALRGWDRKNNAQSRGALLFHQFWNKMVQTDLLKVPASGNPELGSQLEMTSGSAPVIIEALETSVTELTDFGFSPDEPWGNALYQTADSAQIPLHGGSYQEGILNGEMPAPLTEKGFPYILFGTAYVQLVKWESGQIVVEALLSHGQRDGVESAGRTAQLRMFSNKQLYRVPYLPQELAGAELSHSAFPEISVAE
ncbi:penicillin acylase family protein [Vibrio quintilis]|uniref:Acyl-homoserine lactone acylase PvdQ n=1 Tax=Vibrio quintilis TaxID=1117707 RepID=A0A1M7Z295_9VIBR|nr:penicillin acylase family protein [Vibrio quintilis]SHO59001.1 Acyl-homoserine lactone acylase PvdQ precursor [Vibrio quintilis]